MCELFGVSSKEKISLNALLREFFSHGTDHPHGWGMAFFYPNAVSLEKQPEHSCKSVYLKQRLRAKIKADNMIAHIRLATRGNMDYENTHPFVMRDCENRTWTLAHNGTIFECDALVPLVHEQQGGTDSERILVHIINQMNEKQKEKKRDLTQEERFWLMDEIICDISPENKLNLIFYDGEMMYVHTNYKRSLFWCRKGGAVVFSTKPLDRDIWEELPMNTLQAYRDGRLVYMGTNHGNEFVDSEEKMQMLFLDFSSL